MNAPHEITEEAFNRLHKAINERRKGSLVVKVNVDDLKALLYDYARQVSASPRELRDRPLEVAHDRR